MDFDDFSRSLKSSLPEGIVLQNPGRGTSTVEWCDGERVCYRRRGLRLYVNIRDLHQAFLRLSGQDVTTNKLKGYAPDLFDSDQKGHNCHCTFFFMALKEMGIVSEIWGRGHANSPFGVTLPPSPTSV